MCTNLSSSKVGSFGGNMASSAYTTVLSVPSSPWAKLVHPCGSVDQFYRPTILLNSFPSQPNSTSRSHIWLASQLQRRECPLVYTSLLPNRNGTCLDSVDKMRGERLSRVGNSRASRVGRKFSVVCRSREMIQGVGPCVVEPAAYTADEELGCRARAGRRTCDRPSA